MTVKNNHVKPAKKAARAKTPRYFAYILSVGKVEYIDNKKEAKAFEKDQSEIIIDTIKFFTKKEYNDHKAHKHVATPTKSTGIAASAKPSLAVFTKEESEKMKAVLARIEEERAGDCLEVHFKTATKATIAVFCLRFKNQDKKDDWRIKPNSFCVALRNAVQDFPHPNLAVNLALSQLEYGVMRDTSKAPNEPVATEWISPKQVKYMYLNYVIYGSFPIPLQSLESSFQEGTYIENTCREIGKGILHIMQQEFFKPCYQCAIKRETVWAAIADETNVNKQYWSYAKGASVKPIKCESFNRHLVTDDATLVVGMLYDSHQSNVKFPDELKALAGSDDSEESEEEDDNKSSSSHGSRYKVKKGVGHDTNVETAGGGPNENDAVDDGPAAKRRRGRPRKVAENDSTG